MYQRIRDLREDMDLSQREMAKLLHCSQSVYSDYECGRVKIPIDIVIRLADIYQTSCDFLLNLTDEKRPYPDMRAQ